MMTNQTLHTLRTLKLTGMADGLEQQLSQPGTHEELGFEERLALLVDRESTHRHNNKISRLLKAANRLRQNLPWLCTVDASLSSGLVGALLAHVTLTGNA
jgi:hypothetical protein